MRTATTFFVVFFALAILANGAVITDSTTTLNESFVWWDNPIGGNAFNFGSISTRNTLYNQSTTNSWLDWLDAPWPQQPWFSNFSYSRLENFKSVTIGTRRNGDETGSFGTSDTLYNSKSFSTVSTMGSTLYPEENRLHIDIQKYKTLDSVLYSSLYSWDCRNLIQANLSGACAGTNDWERITTYQGLGGFYISFDLLGDLITNWTTGTIQPWSYSFSEAGSDMWDNQPFNSSPTPEPGTWALIGSVLVGLPFLRRFRRG